MDQAAVGAQVQALYENIGWRNVGSVTFDAATSEDLRKCAAHYVSACRLRVLRYLPDGGRRLLDMASGPIQYPEYLRYSENFETRVCVDLSERALQSAREKIGDRGEYHVGDFLDLSIEEVDAAVSLHTIYHIHAASQEAAVRKLVATTKPGGVVVIVYSNPWYFVSLPRLPFRLAKRMWSRRRALKPDPKNLYFRSLPLTWWRRFRDVGEVRIYPWRTFTSQTQRLLFPDNKLGELMFRALFRLEDAFPRFFALVGCYPMIVIRRSA